VLIEIGVTCLAGSVYRQKGNRHFFIETGKTLFVCGQVE
jgi:hypothetical protein